MKPLHDRVLLKRTDAEKVTQGGIIIPEKAKERPDQGAIVALGPQVESPLQEGDLVLFAKYAGADIGDGMLIVREDDILAVVEP